MSTGKAVKKPIPINFLVWDGNSDSLQFWMDKFNQKIDEHFILQMMDEEDELKVKTLEGSSYVVPTGYIIIRGIKGEYYPCEPQIFKESYDIVEGLMV